MKNTLFIFAYYSFKDPVFQSAVLPYLKAVQADNLRYVLLTWEQKQFPLSKKEIGQIEIELAQHNIIWKRTRWHSGSFKIVKKLFDFCYGLVYSLLLIFKYRANKIFSEGFPGAVIGHYLSKISGKPHIVHTFEPHADYMLESGVWQASSWEYRFLKRMELPIANHAQHIITATSAYRDVLIQIGVKSTIHVIPSCINLADYKYDEVYRKQIRALLKISDDQIVIVYLGKVGGMYMEDELFSFFAYCLAFDYKRFHFFLFTNQPQSSILKKLTEFSIPSKKILTRYLNKNEVSKYLSAADIAFCGIRPIPSRRFSSPIKNGEYWACGLPTLIPKGISDDFITVEKANIGKSFDNISEVKINDFDRLLTIPRTKIRSLALRDRNISSYIDILNIIFTR